MALHRFPLPASLNGEALTAELVAAGVEVRPVDVYVVDDELVINAPATAAAVRSVLNAHTGQPTPERQAELARAARLAQLRQKGAAAMTAAERNEAIDLLLGRG